MSALKGAFEKANVRCKIFYCANETNCGSLPASRFPSELDKDGGYFC